MKVADFGFSRNITEKEYYRSLTNVSSMCPFIILCVHLGCYTSKMGSN